MDDIGNFVSGDETRITAAPRWGNHQWLLTGLAAALLYVAGSASLHFHLQHQVSALERQQVAVEQRTASLEASLQATTEMLSATGRQLAKRTMELQRAQRAAESRLASKQKEQLSAVSTEVTGVRSEVGSVRGDISATRLDLEATKAKLERAIGDLGLQSGLIARTREELEVLKHRGDRNYYEFTLLKGKAYTPISTISLQLKKADMRKSKFTINVLADDKTIEKKDRSANEPLQFYTGRERMLYELVVNTVEKNKISGYLATPKDAPQPVIAQ